MGYQRRVHGGALIREKIDDLAKRTRHTVNEFFHECKPDLPERPSVDNLPLDQQLQLLKQSPRKQGQVNENKPDTRVMPQEVTSARSRRTAPIPAATDLQPIQLKSLTEQDYRSQN